MAEPGFYNNNRNRIYPLVEPVPPAVGVLSDALLADAGFLMGVNSGFVPGTHTVWIDTVVKAVVDTVLHVIITVVSDAPGLAGRSLSFACPVNAEPYQTIFAESTDTPADIVEVPTPEELYSDSLYCDDPILWSGFIVFGDLVEGLPGSPLVNGSVDTTEFEPGVVQTLYRSFVSSLNIANQDRSRATLPLDCSESLSFGFPTGSNQLFVAGKCLSGDVQLMAGFNTVIRQDDFANALVFTAAKGAGEGEPCEEVKLFYGEQPPPGRTLLDGSLGCREIVRTINGMGGQTSFLTSGVGVQVTTDPQLNRILVDVNMSQLFVCYDSDYSVVSEQI